MNSRYLGLALLSAASVVIASSVSASTEAVNAKAIAFVKKSGVDAIKVLGAGDMSAADRKVRFRTLILETFDEPAIARLVLGRYWDTATADQRTHFVDAFKEALVHVYMTKFFDYSGESLSVSDAKADAAGSIVVHSEIQNPTGTQSYDLDWHVVDTDRAPKLIDLSIDGVSTTLTQKQDYASVLQTSGGNVDDLIGKLKSQAQD